MKVPVLALRFLSELAMLAAFACWGVHLGHSAIAVVALGIALPLAAAALWARAIAPNADRRLPDPGRLGAELVLFALGGIGLIEAGHPLLALGFMAWAVTMAALTRVVGEEVATA